MSAVEEAVREGVEEQNRFFSVDSRTRKPVTISLVWDGSPGIMGEVFLWVGKTKRYECSLLDLDASAKVKTRLKNCETGAFVNAFRISNPETLSKLRLTFNAIVDDSSNKRGLSTSFIETDIDILPHSLEQGKHYNLVINGINLSITNLDLEKRLSASFTSVESEPGDEQVMVPQ